MGLFAFHPMTKKEEKALAFEAKRAANEEAREERRAQLRGLRGVVHSATGARPTNFPAELEYMATLLYRLDILYKRDVQKGLTHARLSKSVPMTEWERLAVRYERKLRRGPQPKPGNSDRTANDAIL